MNNKQCCQYCQGELLPTEITPSVFICQRCLKQSIQEKMICLRCNKE